MGVDIEYFANLYSKLKNCFFGFVLKLVRRQKIEKWIETVCVPKNTMQCNKMGSLIYWKKLKEN